MVFVPRGVAPKVERRVMVPENVMVRVHCGSLRIREERRRAWVDGWAEVLLVVLTSVTVASLACARWRL